MRPRWVENTSVDLAAVIANDPVVILPVGSTEQHGPHLPVGCDAFVPEILALHAAEACADGPAVLVMPPVWCGYAPHHMGFAGTVTLRNETFIDVLTDLCDSLCRQGVRRVIILNGHGGNAASVDVAALRVGEAWHGRGHIVAITYWSLIAHRTAEFRESDHGGTGHAGEFETSIMLATHSDLVHMDRAVTHYPNVPFGLNTDLFGQFKVGVYKDFRDLSPTGTLGDANLATKEKGERILTAATEEIAVFVKEFAKWPLTFEEN